jgi:lipopolysaccharide transport system ATP-binding protein
MLERDLAIQVDSLSKRYRLGLKEQTHQEFATSVFNFIKKPIKNYRKYRSLYEFDDDILQESKQLIDTKDILWALKNVSFDVKKGEVLGIIGTNGAGKSTLLKVLSRITIPTSGRVQMRGRISSLLEVGTGFHPELTGRENVYLNGTILGMKKKEIDKLFDKIVAFSGVDKFLDTPVKRYSSGMRVRLAFSVAAHLEPEILIIDEVLAVGDVGFQQKCIGKMQEVGKSGKTVLFVSHNMSAITRMCERVILLDAGRKIFDGPTQEVISKYLKGDEDSVAFRKWTTESAPTGDVARLNSICVRDELGNANEAIDIRQNIRIEINFDVIKPGYVLLPTFSLWSEDGICVLDAVDLDPEWRERNRPIGNYIATALIPGNMFGEVTFSVSTGMLTLQPKFSRQYRQTDVIKFRIIDSVNFDSARGDWTGNLQGFMRPKLKWITKVSLNSLNDSHQKYGTN